MDQYLVIKTQSINNITAPTFWKGACIFIGLVNYYRYIWEKPSHTLVPLTKSMYNLVKFKCNEIKQNYFKEINKIVGRNILLAYPNFNKELKSIPMLTTSN